MSVCVCVCSKDSGCVDHLILCFHNRAPTLIRACFHPSMCHVTHTEVGSTAELALGFISWLHLVNPAHTHIRHVWCYIHILWMHSHKFLPLALCISIAMWEHVYNVQRNDTIGIIPELKLCTILLSIQPKTYLSELYFGIYCTRRVTFSTKINSWDTVEIIFMKVISKHKLCKATCWLCL